MYDIQQETAKKHGKHILYIGKRNIHKLKPIKIMQNRTIPAKLQLKKCSNENNMISN